MQNKKRTEDDFYRESKRLRMEVLEMAESLKAEPMRFTITNGIRMNVEITKSDLKTIVSKASRDNKFNAIIDQYTFENSIGELQKGTPL